MNIFGGGALLGVDMCNDYRWDRDCVGEVGLLMRGLCDDRIGEWLMD